MMNLDPTADNSEFDDIISTLNLHNEEAPFSFHLQPSSNSSTTINNNSSHPQQQQQQQQQIKSGFYDDHDETDLEDDDSSLIDIANAQRSRLLPNIRTKGEEKIDLSSFEGDSLDDDDFLTTPRITHNPRNKRIVLFFLASCIVVVLLLGLSGPSLPWRSTLPDQISSNHNSTPGNDSPRDAPTPTPIDPVKNRNSENEPKEPKSPPSNSNRDGVPTNLLPSYQPPSYTHPGEQSICVNRTITTSSTISWFKLFPITTTISPHGGTCFSRLLPSQSSFLEFLMKVAPPIHQAAPLNTIHSTISQYLRSIVIPTQLPTDSLLQRLPPILKLQQNQSSTHIKSQISLIHTLLSKHTPPPARGVDSHLQWAPLLSSRDSASIAKQQHYSPKHPNNTPFPTPPHPQCSAHGCCATFESCFQSCLNTSQLVFDEPSHSIHLLTAFSPPLSDFSPQSPLFIINNNLQTLESPWMYHYDVLNRPLSATDLTLNTLYSYNNNHATQRVFQDQISQTFDHSASSQQPSPNSTTTTLRYIPQSVHTHILHTLCTVQCNSHSHQSLRNGNSFHQTPFIPTTSPQPPIAPSTSAHDSVSLQPGFCYHTLHHQLSYIHSDLAEISRLSTPSSIHATSTSNTLSTHDSHSNHNLLFILGANNQSCDDICNNLSLPSQQPRHTQFKPQLTRLQQFSHFDVFLPPSRTPSPSSSSPFRCYESLFPLILHAIQNELNSPQLSNPSGEQHPPPFLLYYSKYTTQPFISTTSPLLADYPSNAIQQERRGNHVLPHLSQHTTIPLSHGDVGSAVNTATAVLPTITPTITFPPFVSPYSSFYSNPPHLSAPSPGRAHEPNFLHLVTWNSDDLRALAVSPRPETVSSPKWDQIRASWSSLSNLFVQFDCRVSSPFQQRICPCLGVN